MLSNASVHLDGYFKNTTDWDIEFNVPADSVCDEGAFPGAQMTPLSAVSQKPVNSWSFRSPLSYHMDSFLAYISLKVLPLVIFPHAEKGRGIICIHVIISIISVQFLCFKY